MSLRILLADDAPAVRQGVRGLLERQGFEVVDGREAVREIRQVCPWTHLILLTVHSEEHQIVRAFLVGIRGYVVKTHAAEDLARAIEEVSRGGIFLSDSASHVLVESYLPQTNCPLPLDHPGATCGICGFCPSPPGIFPPKLP